MKIRTVAVKRCGLIRAWLLLSSILGGLSSRGDELGLQVWWVDSLTNLLIGDEPAKTQVEGRLDAAQGEMEAIQLAIRGATTGRVKVAAGPVGPGLDLRIRAVGRVPIVRGTHYTPANERVAESPVDLPDPLLPRQEIVLKLSNGENTDSGL